MTSIKTYIWIAIAGFALSCFTACGDDGGEPPPPDNQDLLHAQDLWTDYGDTYGDWDRMPGTLEFNPSMAPHGDYARILVNDTAMTDLAALAEGSIIIKRNYQSEAEEDYDSVTLMQRREAGYSPEAGDWFWAKYNPDGTVQENADGDPLAGQIGLGAAMGCIPCHGTAEGDDYVFLNDLPANFGYGGLDDLDMLTNIWTNDIGDYSAWNLMPNTVDFEPSAAPHGAFARIFINGAMEADPTNPAEGSIVIKQNYATDTEDDYDALTIMVKVAGYSPDAGDWFWAKTNPDGTPQANPAGVPLVGRVGINGGACIECHGTEPDYLFKN